MSIHQKINLRHNMNKYNLKSRYWNKNCGKHDKYNTILFYWYDILTPSFYWYDIFANVNVD